MTSFGLSLFICVSILNAQALIPRTSVSPTPSADALPAQTIGPDDLIAIMVSDCPELSRCFRVSSDGTLALPLLGHRIPASGLMPVQLEDELAKEFTDGQILVQPRSQRLRHGVPQQADQCHRRGSFAVNVPGHE